MDPAEFGVETAPPPPTQEPPEHEDEPRSGEEPREEPGYGHGV